MKKLLMSAIVFLTVFAYAETMELIGIPPQIQGVWENVGLSKDGGVTIENGGNVPFCKVTVNKVLNTNGSKWSVKKVIQGINADDGSVFIGVSFYEISSIWCITSKGADTIMVQVFNQELTKENLRVLFRVIK